MVSLMPLVWFDATLHGYESWFVGHLQASFSLSLYMSSHHFFCIGDGVGVR